MGEEQKEEEKKEEGEKKEEEAKKEEEKPPDIVLRVDMHCEGCAKKVSKALRGFEGVEEVKIDSKARKVVVKGQAADPVKVCERVQRKTGRKTEIISPLPKPPQEEKKEEAKDAPPEEKKEEPKPITVILKIRMHCEACAQVLQKRIKKMEGVDSVVTDLGNNQIIVKGVFDSEKLVDSVYRKTKRQASVVKDEEKKNEENGEQQQEKKEDEKKNEEEKPQDENNNNNNMDLNKYEYWPPRYYVEYSYYPPPPQIFSDENPNACSVM